MNQNENPMAIIPAKGELAKGELAIIYSLLTALAELPDDYIGREGPLYAPFMKYGLDAFQAAIAQLVARGFLLRLPSFGVKITLTGRAMAAKFEAVAQDQARDTLTRLAPVTK